MTVDKVAWFDAREWEKNYLDDKKLSFDVKFIDESLGKENLNKVGECDAVTVFVSSKVDEDVLKNLSVDLVACRSTGYDNIDIETASEEGITVTNVPEYGSNTVAEHTFGLILTLSRRINEAIDKVEDGNFSYKGLKGFDLKGKTLGVVGTGKIGQKVIEIAKGFQMDIIAYDALPKENLEGELGFKYVTKEHLMKECDVITLHCPLTEENKHMISRNEFDSMEETLIVNTARGELIDTKELINALEKDEVLRAGLDVIEEECLIEDDIEVLTENKEACKIEKALEDHILMEREDVIVTPHNAFNSEEALERILEETLENLRNSKNPVN